VKNSADKKVLIIDDLESMRTQLRLTMSTAGFVKIQAARDIKDALQRMKETHFDIILCDYIMGDSTDGQQFLEYIRTEDLLSRNTIFFMVTAEQSYSKVVNASECSPDGYLLKPFTGSQFDARLEILMEKQAYLSHINTSIDQKNWGEVINRCDKKMAADDPQQNKYLIDLLKIKGLAYQHRDEYGKALKAFQDIIAIRPLGWAKLGLSRMMHLMGDTENAQVLLNEVIKDAPQFLAAYDFIGQVMVETGNKKGALDILLKTRKIAAGSLPRLRQMSHLALHLNKPAIAEELMQLVIKKNKFSPVREMNDYVMLSKAMVAQERQPEAIDVLKAAADAFPDGHESVLLLSAVSSAYFSSGNYKKAASALEEAMSVVNTGNLSSQATLNLSTACLLLGRDEQAHEYLSNVVRHAPEQPSANDKIRDVCAMAGKNEEQTTQIIEAVHETISQAYLEAENLAVAGRFADSIKVLFKEIEKAPNNLKLKSNAAMLFAIDMICNGPSVPKMEQCLKLKKVITQKSPSYPKLIYLDALLTELGIPV
jgi:tetratricopeptide (TPR) repeat protein